MHPTDDERIVLDIGIPKYLLTPEVIAEALSRQQRRSESFRRTAGRAADRINVPKKRQQLGVTWESSQNLTSGAGTPRTNYLRALEEGIEGTSEAEIPFQEKEVIQPSRLNGSRFPPCETPPFIRAASQEPFDQSRYSSYSSGYNMASLVNIKHRRKYWHRKLIEYGAYTFFASVIYFVVIGVPLWRGMLYWLYRLMQTHNILHGGWVIIIVMLIV
jgi:hypothetical protein